jgi:hypothetical protein
VLREVRQVARGWVGLLCERLHILCDRLVTAVDQGPEVDAAHVQILVRVRLDVVDLRVVHRCTAGVYPAEHLWPRAGERHVLEVEAPLLPPHGHQIWSDEREQRVARPCLALRQAQPSRRGRHGLVSCCRDIAKAVPD